MDEISILLATDSERDWAAKVMAGSDPWITLRVSADQLRSVVLDKEYKLFIAHLGDTPVGLIILQDRGVAGSPYLKSIAVAEGSRGKRIGEAMIRFAEEMYRPRSKHFFLCVSSFNTRAKAWYEHLGFRAVGEFEDYVIQGASEILMYKALQ